MRWAVVALGLFLLAGAVAAQVRLEADGTRIRGERETAQALAIVPWREGQGAVPPDLAIQRRLAQPLRPLERTIFENRLLLHRQRRAATASPSP